jgi:arylsulfatase A-like enzyme
MKNSNTITAIFTKRVLYSLIFWMLLSFNIFGQERPNIVLIMVDDMGFSDIAPYGGEIETPNLDKLSANGVRFTQFYNTSRCCPSRASLLTGLDHHQAGMGHMIEDRTELPGYLGHLARKRCTTIAEVLKGAGYGTYMSGKWHLGYREGERPLEWGFDRFYGSLEGAISFFEPGNTEKYPHDKNPRYVTLDNDTIKPDKNFYATNRFTDYGKLFLDQHFNERKEDPFFMYMAYNAPHWPLHALPQDIEKYEGKYLKGWDKLRKERYERQLEIGVLKAENTRLSLRTDDRYEKGGRWPFTRDPLPAWNSLNEDQKKDLAKRMAVYAAMVDNVDQNIGRLMDFLEEKGELDNTILLFLSDNGGAIGGRVIGMNALGQRGNLDAYGTTNSFISYGLGWANASNTPFRMYKCYVHEGGISTPLIVHWPNGIKNKPGSFVRTPAHITDIMPTLLEAAGAEYPEEVNGNEMISLQGQSLIPLITDNSRQFNENRQLYWEHAGSKAVRDGKWKLVQIHEGPWELYNMNIDRSETINLIRKYPERAKRMEEMYNNWADTAYVNPPLFK